MLCTDLYQFLLNVMTTINLKWLYICNLKPGERKYQFSLNLSSLLIVYVFIFHSDDIFFVFDINFD